MKRILLFFFVPALFHAVCSSQTVASPYEVATWAGFRDAAVSYTFDDNCPNQLALAVPVFNTYGFTVTLFTVTNWSPDWAGLQNAANAGHEIADHTVSHPSLGTLTVEQQRTEITTAADLIDAHITGQRCITLAYPNCSEGSDTLCERYFVAARGCQGFIEGSTPGNFMNVSSLICGELGSVKTAQDFRTRDDDAASSHGWLVYLIHGIDNDGGYSPLSSDTLRAGIEYLNANGRKYWVSAFGDVARYIKERNSVSVSEVSAHDSTLTVHIVDTLDDSLYNVPVTIRRPLPQDWNSATAWQDNHPVTSSIVEVDSTRYIMFEAVPDRGDVELRKVVVTGMSTPEPSLPANVTLRQNYPNPFNPSTEIEYQVPRASEVSLRVYNVLGRSVATLVDGTVNAGTHRIAWNATNLASGVYFCRLQAGNQTLVKRLLLVK